MRMAMGLSFLTYSRYRRYRFARGSSRKALGWANTSLSLALPTRERLARRPADYHVDGALCLAAELEFGDELFRLNPIKITLTAYPGRLLRLIVRSLLGHATISHTMDNGSTAANHLSFKRFLVLGMYLRSSLRSSSVRMNTMLGCAGTIW